ncbi:MAG: hypothetical protein UIH99_04295 [Alphaproteobacteria bacterium]|nr:hypothetical protein [Alphaproteobacteria bacterium]
MSKFRKIFANIICGFVPNKSRRDLLRVRLRYNTRPFVRFVRDYIGDTDARITTCVGYGCTNFIVLVDSRYAFKFPLLDDGHDRAVRELQITNALRPHTTFKIPQMEIIHWNNLSVRKYEFFPGAVLGEFPTRLVLHHRYHLARQIALFIYQIGAVDPVSIRDFKPVSDTRPTYMHGWFHNDIGQNFIIDPETFDIVGFIDWETVIFGPFEVGFYQAAHHWDKLGYRGLMVDVMHVYSELYYGDKVA